MKTLIIHHLESLWETAYRKRGTSFNELAEGVIEWIEENDPGEVILTQFENWEPQNEHIETGLNAYVNKWFDYGYGWDQDCISEEERTDLENDESDRWAWGGNHSELVMLESWMRKLKGEVFICGAFDGECIEDLECALNALEVNFTRINKLIV